MDWLWGCSISPKDKNDILVKLIKIYDGLEESTEYIRDILTLEYGGFTFWKKSVDAYYKHFDVYRAHLMLYIFTATNAYIMGKVGKMQSQKSR